jgi:hypothetical protein
MKKKVVGILLLVAAMAAPAAANDWWYWADEQGFELTDAIVAAPGDTVKVWAIARTNIPGWPPQYKVALECWWDTAVIDHTGTSVFYEDYTNYYLGDDVTPTYMVSDWTVGNYGAGPDFAFPDYAHYGAVVLQDVFYQYAGMRMVGIEFKIQDTAPTGVSSLGGRSISWNYWNGGIDQYEAIESDDPVYALRIDVRPGAEPGDFDQDGDVDADDIDLLFANLGGVDLAYDLTGDGLVNSADVDEWVFNIVPIGANIGTVYGDFNLDGAVDAGDLALLGTNFGAAGSFGWADGDATGDGVVDAGDLALLGSNFGTVVHPVPEPVTMSLLAIGGAALLRRRK